MCRYLCEEKFQILISIQTVCLCSFNQTVDGRAGFGTAIRSGKDEVLSADCKGTDGLFAELFSYMDNTLYAQDIFILILIKSPLKHNEFIGKDEDNIYLNPQILASSSSSSGHRGFSAFNSGLALSMASLSISRDGLA